jgi:diguanylate cyclase (GGDEF)-like protein
VSSPTIGAYLGIPLRLPDGSLNGTLCALHPTAVPETVAADLPLIEMVSELLGSALSAESALARVQRRAERAEGEAMTDALTGLFNRRGWDQLLATEESRCQRFAHPACVLSVDLDALKAINDRFGHAVGDQLIRKTGDVLRAATRQQDVVARVGGDEFAVLGVECANPKALAHGVQAALLEAGIEASVGYAARHPLKGLVRAQQEADQTMYRRKRARRRGRSGSPTSLSSAAAAPGGWMLRVS